MSTMGKCLQICLSSDRLFDHMNHTHTKLRDAMSVTSLVLCQTESTHTSLVQMVQLILLTLLLYNY